VPILTKLHEDVLLSCYDDATAIAQITLLVNGRGYSKYQPLPAGIRDKTLMIVKDLLEEGLILAGFPGDVRFEEWSVNIEQTLGKIAREWDEIREKGLEPGIGDIVWFDTTKKGIRLAQEIIKRRRGLQLRN
jgi:hypothetical protein